MTLMACEDILAENLRNYRCYSGAKWCSFPQKLADLPKVRPTNFAKSHGLKKAKVSFSIKWKNPVHKTGCRRRTCRDKLEKFGKDWELLQLMPLIKSFTPPCYGLWISYQDSLFARHIYPCKKIDWPRPLLSNNMNDIKQVTFLWKSVKANGIGCLVQGCKWILLQICSKTDRRSVRFGYGGRKRSLVAGAVGNHLWR